MSIIAEDEVFKTIYTLENSVIKHDRYKDAFKTIVECYRKSAEHNIYHHTSCWGQPGTGKSTLLEDIKRKYPTEELKDRIIQHVVCVVTPSSPTKKRLAEAILQELGDESYLKGDESAKTDRIEKLFKSLGVKMVILDELQHFVDQNNSKILWDVTDWLKRLEARNKVCFILLGLKRGKQVMSRNSQLARRFSRHIDLPAFSIAREEEKSSFASVVHHLFRIPPITFPSSEMDDDFIKRYFYATEGIIDFMVKLIVSAFEYAVNQACERMTYRHLEYAFKQVVWAEANIELNPFSDNYSYKRLTARDMPFYNWSGDVITKAKGAKNTKSR